MLYVYHRVPKNMIGTMLYPLNELKRLYPEIYDAQVKKYEGRERLLTAEVPPLNCLWNDVLHLTAVSPQELKANLAKANIELPSVPWFKIPASSIVGENSIAFTYRRDLNNAIPIFKEYEVFDPHRIDMYRAVPHETIEYYKQKKKEGVRPLFFHLVPHILYRGSLNTTDFEAVCP